jgi:hypothetical protein
MESLLLTAIGVTAAIVLFSNFMIRVFVWCIPGTTFRKAFFTPLHEL